VVRWWQLLVVLDGETRLASEMPHVTRALQGLFFCDGEESRRTTPYPPTQLVHRSIYTSTMFRTVILASARAATHSCMRRPAAIASPIVRRSVIPSAHFAPATSFNAIRCYSASAGLSKDEVQGRIMDLLKNFDKVTDASKVMAAPEN